MSNQATFAPVSSTQVTVEQSAVDAKALQTDVVSNDTPSTEPSVVNVKSSTAVIKRLVAEREQWEMNAYRTSNEQLYGILQNCYLYYKSMEGTSNEAVMARKGLNDYIASKGYSFDKSTHTTARIVKCVFGTSGRQRISAYSIVIRAAISKNIGVMEFPAFIRDSGGVEEIRLAKAPNAMTATKKSEVVTEAITQTQLAVVSSAAFSGMLDVGKIGTNTVLIGTWQADGSIVIRALVESDTVLNAALASHYKNIKDEIKAKAIETEAANDEQIKKSAIDAAVSTATLVA